MPEPEFSADDYVNPDAPEDELRLKRPLRQPGQMATRQQAATQGLMAWIRWATAAR
ncbi:hypothetical protein [Streptomyces atratus]|uniref:hypothetical protein n=1 Tax=Streptomyces atratus TaxID=1893 RepID=UPI0037920631